MPGLLASKLDSPFYILQQRINVVRSAGKSWAQRKRLAGVSSTKVAAELQTEATKLQADPGNLEIQTTYRELKSKLIELQHKELLDVRQKAHVNWIT